MCLVSVKDAGLPALKPEGLFTGREAAASATVQKASWGGTGTTAPLGLSTSKSRNASCHIYCKQIWSLTFADPCILSSCLGMHF